MSELSEDLVSELQQKIDELTIELQDLRIIHENTVDHSTRIENELEEKNERINKLLTSMKMYLSPQLYQSIVGGAFEAKLRHQRKKLTMFFSDIVGFTKITDVIEPETLSGLLNEYLTKMSDIAAMYGGTIDKYIGDAIVIFFGDPEYVDDAYHARQCMRMGMEMLDQIRLLSRRWSSAGAPGGLGVRMGVNTGFCTVGNFGSETRMDYTIIGGQVNIASRLEKIADKNSMFISESTYSLVKDFVEVGHPQVVHVKGIHFPVGVYKVLGLQEDYRSGSELIEKSSNGFFLHPINYEKESDSAQTRKRMIDALESALKYLKENR